MTLKKGHERVFLNLHPNNKKVDYQALANQVRLEIDLNNQKTSSYLAYFLGIISVFITIYIFLLNTGLDIKYSLIYLGFFIIIILIFILKMNRIIKINEGKIEGYMGIQSYLSGSKLFILEGKKKKIEETIKNLSKIPGLKKKDLMGNLKKEAKEIKEGGSCKKHER